MAKIKKRIAEKANRELEKQEWLKLIQIEKVYENEKEVVLKKPFDRYQWKIDMIQKFIDDDTALRNELING